MYISNFGYFSFVFRGQDFGSDCTSSWSLLTCLLFCGTLPKSFRVDSVISVNSFEIPFYDINCHSFKLFFL